MNIKAVVINPRDNVATVVVDVAAGETVNYAIDGEYFNFTAMESIPLGHKIAIVKIDAMQDVLKYGESIGRATKSIEQGQHVHVHNMESQRGRGDWS